MGRISLVDCFGFHTAESWKHTEVRKSLRSGWNNAIWHGYIPIFSLISGAGRIYHTLKNVGEKKLTISVAALVASVVRGVLEMCCVGFLYALIDIPIYCIRRKNEVTAGQQYQKNEVG